MNLLELQISFQKMIEDVNPAFKVEERPNTHTIVDYLNRSIRQYLKTRFMDLPTLEMQRVAIEENRDDLRFLLVRGGVVEYAYALDTYNWGSRGKRYRVPDNLLVPMSISATISREEIAPMSNQKMFCEWTSRLRAEKIVSDSSNKTIHIKPLAFIEDEFYVCVIGDAYTTSIAANEITYLRKPDRLSFDYQELSGTVSLSVSGVANGTDMRALRAFTYVDADGNPKNFIAGEKVKKISGYNTITALSGEPIAVGYPWGYTDTPDFPEYMHEMILERAVEMFLDEAKLKLVPKAQS